MKWSPSPKINFLRKFLVFAFIFDTMDTLLFFGKKEKDRIVVTDFLVHFDNGKGLDLQAVQRELGTAIIDMMCSAPFPSEIFIPIELPSWEIDQIDIFHGESGMVFRNIEPHVVM